MFRRSAIGEECRFAIICALPLEYDAVYDSLDEIWKHSDFDKADGDSNRYTTGRMANVAVVLVLLPEMGKVSAASAVANLQVSFPDLNLALLVGICGAVPRLSNGTEVILGDVIISKYVVRHDIGSQYPGGFKATRAVEDKLGRPNKESRDLSAQLETRSGRDKLEASAHDELQNLQARMRETKYRGLYNYVGVANDQLFNAGYRHKHHISTCDVCNACCSCTDPVCEYATESKCMDLGCRESELVFRNRLKDQQVSDERREAGPPALAIHIGGIGSADSAIKSGGMRDRLAKRERVIGFEMEGASIWDELSTYIIIKGVCDYADSHKTKGWQNYAAATAASATKALLRSYSTDRESNGRIKDSIILLEHAVKMQETNLREDHPSRLASQHELAVAYRTNGQIQHAIALLEHVVKIQETNLKEDHQSQLTSQHELAVTYYTNGQIQHAITLLEHIIKLWKTTLKEDHPDRLASQHALAVAYRANGQVQHAIALLEYVVKIKGTTLKEDHPSRLASQHELARANCTARACC